MLLPEPAAGSAAFFLAWLFLFWTVREAVKASGHSGWHIVFAQGAIAATMAASRQPQALQVSTAVSVAEASSPDGHFTPEHNALGLQFEFHFCLFVAFILPNPPECQKTQGTISE